MRKVSNTRAPLCQVGGRHASHMQKAALAMYARVNSGAATCFNLRVIHVLQE